MTTSITVDELHARLKCFPRAPLAYLPTPLDDAPRVSRALGGPRIVIKRDDLTGLALGGNKTRKLEFLMADAMQKGADTIVTTAAAQSNMCRQTAAAARKLGLDVVLILRGDEREEIQGNLLLDKIFGAQIHFIQITDPYSDVSTQKMQKVADDLARAGKRPYIIDLRTTSAPLAVLGYVAGALELSEQLEQRGIAPSHIFLATGSGGTQAGVLLASEMLGARWKIQGISVQRPADEMRERVARKVREAAAQLSFASAIKPRDVLVDDDYIGPAYGVTTQAGVDAMSLVGRTEGLVMDPTYSGKSFAGLIGHIRQKRLSTDDTVVFIHTGGAPGLFAHAASVSEQLTVHCLMGQHT
ncbi:MAG: D-cysteine desulfhydrase family protein [Chloroflexota bacterium]